MILVIYMLKWLTQLTTGYCYRCIAVCYCFVIGRKSSGRPWDSRRQWECPRAPVLYYQETCRGPLWYWHCVRTGCLLDNCVWVVDGQPTEGRGAVFVVFCLELITSTTDFQFILAPSYRSHCHSTWLASCLQRELSTNKQPTSRMSEESVRIRKFIFKIKFFILNIF